MRNPIEELYKPNELSDDLITNEDAINKIKESKKTNWDYVFADSVENEEEDNQEIKYRMRETDKPATYETEFDYYDPTTIQIETEIKGQKKWLGDTKRSRPYSITVYLLANGEQVDEKRVTAKNNWLYGFTNIPVYDAAGEKIVYTIKEKNIQGYQTSYDRYDIINLQMELNENIENETNDQNLETGRATRVGLFVLGAAAITAGLLLDQIRKEK